MDNPFITPESPKPLGEMSLIVHGLALRTTQAASNDPAKASEAIEHFIEALVHGIGMAITMFPETDRRQAVMDAIKDSIAERADHYCASFDHFRASRAAASAN